METLLKADIFFFITAIAVAVIAVIFAVVLVYAVTIARNVRDITAEVKQQTRKLSADIDTLREKAKEKKLFAWGEILANLFDRGKKGRKR